MKTVALISGGKDSCFNMMQCVAEGHQIVALANLRPKDKDEADSYMYQTVGHQAIELYAEAMNLPLYRRIIEGTAVSMGRDYIPSVEDEVEDLYQLLLQVKNELEVEAVAVGAILSDYQRVRVENVCVRLGLMPLAYLWRREQAALLQEMVDCGMDAIIIKVAALGLDPDRHLGMSLRQILPHMLKMQNTYGLNVCGEGGEYESFTLDCPLFQKRIVVDEKETVIHSADAFAPVGYIHFKKMHLEDKGNQRPVETRIKGLPLTTSQSLMDALRMNAGGGEPTCCTLPDLHIPPVLPATEPVTHSCHSRGRNFSFGGMVALADETLDNSTRLAMDKLKDAVERMDRTLADVFSMCLYVKRMTDFAAVNAVYRNYFGINPPVRICVEACLPENIMFLLDCQGCRAASGSDEVGERRTMHVQGISHWAPANIGPYSQATVVDGHVFVAGQIPLVPGSMTLVSGDITLQSRLALQHVASVLEAMCPGVTVPDALLVICYVTRPEYITAARQQLERICDSRQLQDEVCDDHHHHHSLTEFVVVPALPRAASVEWQVYAPASLPVNVKEVKSSLITSDFLVHSTSLGRVDESAPIWASQTRVSFGADHAGSFDCDAAVACCLDCYTALLSKVGKNWHDVPLLRVFYPVQLCSFQSLFAAWRKGLDKRSNSTATFSLIPVVQLSDETKCMSMCH